MRIAGLGISQVPRLLLGLGNGGGRSGGTIEPHPHPQQARAFCRAWSGGGLTLLALCLAVYLPGLWSIPPVDRDESRFAQASRQMFESGDYIVPRIQDRPRLNKPPLIYWLQCASIAVFGDREGQYANANIWVFRMPSVLAAIASVLMTWRMGMKMFDPRAALLGAALLAVSPMIVWDAHQARADQVLMATVVAAQWALYEVWHAASREPRAQARGLVKRWAWPMAFWIAISLGILTKGPIAPMIAALTILALGFTTRSWRWLAALRPIVGVLMVAAVVGPWVYAVIQRVGWPTYWSTIYEETIGRSAEAREGHWGPPGYHLVLLVVLFWPGVLMTAAGVGRAWRRAFGVSPMIPKRQRWAEVHADLSDTGGPRSGSGFFAVLHQLRYAHGRAPELFLLAWIIPAWIVFELIATKLPHYTLPLYPAIAILSARAVLAIFRVRRRPSIAGPAGGLVWGLIGWIVTGLVGGLGLSEMIASAGEPLSAFSKTGVGLAWVVAVLSLSWACGRLLSGRIIRAQVGGVFCAVGLVLAAGFSARAVVPGATTVTLAREIFKPTEQGAARPTASVYHEDSLIFWTRGRAERIDEGQVGEWFDRHPEGICVVDMDGGDEALRKQGLRRGEAIVAHAGHKYAVATRVASP